MKIQSVSLKTLAEEIHRDLQGRGLSFARRSVAHGGIEVVLPAGWEVRWEKDHLVATHGTPPVGELVVFPVALRRLVTASVLVDAYLEECIGTLFPEVDVLQSMPLSQVEGLHRVSFEAMGTDGIRQGMILGKVGNGQGRVVSYHTSQALFRDNLAQDLLLHTLDSIHAPAGSPYREYDNHVPVLEESLIWGEADVLLPVSSAAVRSRVALRLPLGWSVAEVSVGGDTGVLLVPPGRDNEALVISVSGADLMRPLADTLQDAVDSLNLSSIYQREVSPQEVLLGENPGLVQVLVGFPPDTEGVACRIWSFGLTNGESVIHLLAAGKAEVVAEVLPELNAIARHLRILPRLPDWEKMKQVAGTWRTLEAGSDEEVPEVTLHLRDQGEFIRMVRSVRPGHSLLDAFVPSDERAEPSGHWDIVADTLSLFFRDGSRESFEIETLGERTAIMGKLLWQRGL